MPRYPLKRSPRRSKMAPQMSMPSSATCSTQQKEKCRGCRINNTDTKQLHKFDRLYTYQNYIKIKNQIKYIEAEMLLSIIDSLILVDLPITD